MNRLRSLFLHAGLFLLGICVSRTVSGAELQLVPYPNSVQLFPGSCALTDESAVYLDLQGHERTLFLRWLGTSPLKLGRCTDTPERAVVKLLLSDSESELDPEAYVLRISHDEGIRIEASAGAGLFYGLQTLMQLTEQYGRDRLPCLAIEDAPYLRHRGLMIDVSRHYFPKEFLFRQLDVMAHYKLNRFHWHLVDGAGWRIEIRHYPQLTQQAAWRTDESIVAWEDHGLKYATAQTPGAYGGYYTQEEVREVVAYAAERYITVIPEIEMPGHSEEVLAVFPELSCTDAGDRPVDLCIGNPATLVFLENVLNEVLELFPSPYIHIGGDEAAKTAWEHCDRCRKRMEEEELASVEELQSWLIRQMERFLHAHGRRLVGWDEIMQGGLSPDATVMSWRGPQYGLQAAATGHDAILSPIQYCYFNFYQDAPETHVLSWAGYTPLKKVYDFNPIPDTLSVKARGHMLGLQANLWTEYIPTEQQAESMLWPRGLAIAETGWTRPEEKSYARFRACASEAASRLRHRGLHPFDLEREVGERVEYGDTLRHLASGCPVRYLQSYTEEYPAGGDTALTDGLQGGWSYEDGRWQGFIGNDMDVVIDLGAEQPVREIGANFIQDRFGWFWLPCRVEISVSSDNEHFTPLTVVENDLPFVRTGFHLRRFGWEGTAEARYIRYVARYDAANPKKGFLFTDEIVVR
ncbi:family 20 glycosylhydrolase [Alistipes sp.]|uniref:beta-N-acetylhexosaminidase n=1 Tax=Alistipes sp. TaxID=1872444 RepID=UPI0025C286DD|nr:family 20 glycosylhydrolase [Alistipes sp.]